MAFLISLFLLLPSLHQENKVQINTMVEEVTIYRDGAQMVHRASVQLQDGRNEITFTGLSSSLQEQSLRLRSESDIILISMNPQVNYLTDPILSEQIDSLNAVVSKLEIENRQLDAQMNVKNRQIALLTANQNLTGSNQRLSLQELQDALNFYNEALSGIEEEIIQIESRKNEIESALSKIRTQLSQLSRTESRGFYEAVAVIESNRNQSVTFEISYITQRASWFPSYDIRYTSNDKPLELTYIANVTQTTGIKWDNVDLSISSATPQRSSTLPELSTWYLDFIQTGIARILDTSNLPTAGELGISQVQGYVHDAETGERLPVVNVLSPQANVGSPSNRDGYYSFRIPPGAKTLRATLVGYRAVEIPITSTRMDIMLTPDIVGLDDIVVSGYGVPIDQKVMLEAQPVGSSRIDDQLTFSYKVDSPYVIESGSSRTSIRFHSEEVNAEFVHKSIPKLEESAFLIAQIPDWENLNILSGQASLYLNNAYMGRTTLRTDAIGDTLAISVGRDENILVSRRSVREFSSRNFFGNRVRQNYLYEITLRNTGTQIIKLNIQDQMPVSANSDIKVEAQQLSGADYNSTTGVLNWSLTLEPNQSETIQFGYQIEYPRGRRINLR
jgi:hypothetical protein